MAGHHPPNGRIVAHVPRIYRFTATALGAGMWFWVSRPRRVFPQVGMAIEGRGTDGGLLQIMYRAKKDGPVLLGLKHPWDH